MKEHNKTLGSNQQFSFGSPHVDRVEKNSGSPTWSLRSGLLQVAVWENARVHENQQYITRSVTFEKRYKNQQGEWKTSTSYSLADLQRLRYLLAQAEGHLLKHDKED